MTWEYALISLIIGVLIGALIMYFGNPKFYKQKILQNKLEKSNNELIQYRQELLNHFIHSAKLLDNIANDYRQMHDYMTKISSKLLPDISHKDNPFYYHLTDPEYNRTLVNYPPRDYSEVSSSLLTAERHNK
ncbi:Inner membrane protein YhcB [Candidatus Profftia lariciata]|uniref:ZapG family protein n=1 Tax=Candidatus Profftia lariciata TaxID=1987921 RepID=UPI001D030AF0|nr:DUF1043 family protein [Candidatus Profftia lariciata]UDG81497.1 Inner membrane protein YhcB [Candidatus Profftia lariciata]